MADVLFRWLLSARSRETSWLTRPLFLADAMDSSVERVIEAAAIRVEVESQHVVVSEGQAVTGSSMAASLAFHDEPAPTPPVAPHFENRKERFALRGSLVIEGCLECGGSGSIVCVCGGTRQETCTRCSGTGVLTFEPVRCPRCSGFGFVLCTRCGGMGKIRDPRCLGEGQVATWTVVTYSYFAVRRVETVLPSETTDEVVTETIDEWIQTHDVALTEPLNESLREQMGSSTAETMAVAAQATERHKQLERAARLEKGDCLFMESRFRFVPVGACVVRQSPRARADWFWLVGKGERAIEIAPPARMTLSLPPFLSGRRRVQTVAVIPCSGRTAGYLACLAEIGSFTHRIEPLDASYKAPMEELLANAPCDRSGTFAFVEGRNRIRLVEVARAEELSLDELERMTSIVDGILYLEEPGIPFDEVRRRVHASTTARPPEARLLLNRTADWGGSDGMLNGVISMEFLRRAFLRDIVADVDWQAVFEALYSPVRQVLGGRRFSLWPASRGRSA